MIDTCQWRAVIGHWHYSSISNFSKCTGASLMKMFSVWRRLLGGIVSDALRCFSIPLLLLLSGDIEPNPGPTISGKPTFPQIIEWLEPLIAWQDFGHFLPEMPPHVVQKIETDKATITERKTALCRKWLAIYPKATWKDVINALEKIGENAMAENIKSQLKGGASYSTASPKSGITRPRTTPKEKVTFSTQEEEIGVKNELENLEKKFSSLFIKVQSQLDEAAKNQDTFRNIIRWMGTRTGKTKELSDVRTLDAAFLIIEPYYDFIDCRLIVDLSEEFLGPDNEIVIEFKEHKKGADNLRSSTEVRLLTKSLRKIFQDHIPDLTNMPQIVLQLNDAWYTSNIECLSRLIRHLLPSEYQQSLMKYITIFTGSVIIKYTVLDSTADSLIEYAEGKLQFMRLIGVFGFFINDRPVFKDGENSNFTFEYALHKAVRAGHMEAVKFLLDLEIIDINHFDKEGNTALIMACEVGNDDIVHSLLSAGAKVNLQNNNGWTALMKASQYNHISIIHTLLEVNANPHLQNLRGSNALMIAAFTGHYDVVDLLSSKGVDCDHQRENDGVTAFMFACQKGHVQIAELLLKYQADPNARYKDGTNCFIFACNNGHIPIVKLLLRKEFKVDPNVSNNNGWTALMSACANGRTETVELLLAIVVDINIKNNDGWNAFMLACEKGHSEVVELLLKRNIDVNAQNKDGWNGLIMSCKNGHIHIVKLLLKLEEVDCHVRNKAGTNAFMFACKNGLTEVVLALQEKGVNPNLQNNNGLNGFMLACAYGHMQIVTILLQTITDPNLQSNYSTNAFMFACENGHTEVVAMLLEKNVNPNLQNKTGLNGFMLACANGHTRIVELLLKKQVNTNERNKEGISAFIFACKHGHTKIVELLLPYGIQKSEGSQALMCACAFGHTQIVSLLLKESVDANAQNVEGLTAFMFACANGHIQIVETLKEVVDINIQNNEGMNALMLACANGHTKVVQLLLTELKADFNAKNCNGWNALMLASYKDKVDAAQLLLEAGLDPNIQSRQGYTSLMLASAAGNYEMAKLLLENKADPMIQFKDGNTAITIARDAEIASLCQSYSIKDKTVADAAQDEEQKSIISSFSRLSSTSSRSTTLTR